MKAAAPPAPLVGHFERAATCFLPTVAPGPGQNRYLRNCENVIVYEGQQAANERLLTTWPLTVSGDIE